MAGIACSTFSEDGRYFVCRGDDGKLKVWETGTGTLSQEYTPNLHLSSPWSCLTWVATRNLSPQKTTTNKRLKTYDVKSETGVLALGTVSGKILLYSIATSSVVGELRNGHRRAVNYVTWRRGSNLFSCDDQYIVEWDVDKGTVESTWKSGFQRLTCLLVLPDGKSLLAAGSSIGLWDVRSKRLLRKYTGHTSEINTLTLVPSGDNYFLTSAKNDRLLCAWSLNPKKEITNSVASFVMEDIASSVSVSSTDVSTLIAITRTGILHIYSHQLNGICERPLKPKLTVQIASDSDQGKVTVQPIPILGAHQLGSDILIAYGTSVFLTFENISPNYDQKVLFLVRRDPRRKLKSSDGDVSKVRVPEISDNVEYVPPTAAASAGAVKRARDAGVDVPMEIRVDNLSLTRQEDGSKGTPRADSMVHLLMQALMSEDRKLIQSILLTKDPKLISTTVMRLSVQFIQPLAKELVTLLQGKNFQCQIAVLWLKALIRCHAGQLMSNPDIREVLSPIMGVVEARMDLLKPMSKLRGRLDLLVDQIEDSNRKGDITQEIGESLLVYQDQESDNGSALEYNAEGTESDNWEEFSEEEEEEEEETKDDDVSSMSN